MHRDANTCSRKPPAACTTSATSATAGNLVPVGTPWGRVAAKYAAAGGTLVSVTPEFEDCAAVATAAGVPLKTVADAARHAFLMNFVDG